MSLKVERATDVVYLFTPADRKRIGELGTDLERLAQVSGPRRVNDEDPTAAAAEVYDKFLAAASKRAAQVKLTALPGRDWRHMLATYPPRQNVEDADGNVIVDANVGADQQVGFHVDDMSRPLVLASVDVDQFDKTSDLEEFIDDLSDPDFSRIFSAAVRLNTEAAPDPKFTASSWLGLRSAAMSRLDED